MGLTYRGAIALNNIGCSLIRRGRFRQARATLQDAVLLLKVVSAELENKTYKTPSVQAMIEKATQRLADPYSTTSTDHAILIVTDDTCHSSAFEELSKGHERFSQSIVMQIDEYGNSKSLERDLEIDSSIILHNYALTFLHDDGSRKARSRKQMETANKILHLCQHILLRRYNASVDMDFSLRHRMTAVAYVITYTHFKATCLGYFGQQLHADKVYEKLIKLHSTLRLLDGFDALGFDARTAAAA